MLSISLPKRAHGLFALLALLLAPVVGAGSIPDVNKATAHLTRAEANLELVNGAIGHLTSPPKGSKGKLARMRLEQAKTDIEPAGQILAALQGGAGVAEAKTRYGSAVKLYNKLNGILSGAQPKPEPQPKPGPKPDPKPQPETPPAKQTVKLGYPHADNFKNALFTLRRVESDTAGITAHVGQLKPVEDQLTVNHRDTARGIEALTEARRQAGFAEKALAAVPANGEGVAEAKQRLAVARQAQDAADSYLQPLHKQLMAMIDPARFPEYQADLGRLKELARAYQNPELQFREQRERAAEAFTQADAAKAECARIAQAYVRLLQQETNMGKSIEHAGNGLLQGQAKFLALADEQRTALPASIRADLAESDRYATEAVENQKPGWFNGGIPQRMGWAEDKITLLEVLDPAGAAPVRREIEAMQASLATRAASLRELIIKENTLPLDAFAGADRDAAIAMAIDGWKVQQPDVEILAVRIPSEAWARDTKWTYSNGTWYFSDRSRLQVRLIVADTENPELAIDRPINVIKDHQKGDKLIGVPMRSFDEELHPQEYFLRSKVK